MKPFEFPILTDEKIGPEGVRSTRAAPGYRASAALRSQKWSDATGVEGDLSLAQ